MNKEFLAKIAYDYYFLISRGYPQDQALNLLRERHGLTHRLAILVKRCIHGIETVRTIKSRRVWDTASIRDSVLVVDAFNQLTTLYAVLSGYNVYLCTDGFVRDDLLSGPKQVIAFWRPLSEYLAAALQALAPAKTILFFDSQPSHSGKVASMMARMLSEKGLLVEYQVSRHADSDIIRLGGDSIIATSDIVILKSVRRVFDLASYTITVSGLERAVINIPLLLEREHSSWVREGPSPSQDRAPAF